MAFLYIEMSPIFMKETFLLTYLSENHGVTQMSIHRSILTVGFKIVL